MGEADRAVLVSPELEMLEWSCLRLVYQITGSGSLQVHSRPHGENFDYTLWTANKPSDSWLIASVDLRNLSTPYQVAADITQSSLCVREGRRKTVMLTKSGFCNLKSLGVSVRKAFELSLKNELFVNTPRRLCFDRLALF